MTFCIAIILMLRKYISLLPIIIFRQIVIMQLMYIYENCTCQLNTICKKPNTTYRAQEIAMACEMKVLHLVSGEGDELELL